MRKKLSKLLFVVIAMSCIPLYASAAECQHDWDINVWQEPTCQWDGYQDKTCKLCGTTVTFEKIPATGQHDWGEWTVYNEPDCIHSGYRTRSCNECHTLDIDYPPATGIHDWDENTVKPTCTDEGCIERTCNVCDLDEKVILPALGGSHDWGAWKVTRSSTCSEKGSKIRYCSKCSDSQRQSISTASHNWGKWKVYQKPTYSKSGSKSRFCKDCYKEQSKTVPKLKANTKQKKAISTVTKFYAYSKTMNVKKMRSLIYSKPNSYFTGSKIFYSFLKKYNKKIDVNITSAKISSKKAKVKAVVTYKSLYDAYYCSFDDLVSYLTLHPKSKNAQKQFDKFIKNNASSFGAKTVKKTITFSLKKKGSKWKISNMNTAIFDSVTCKYQSAYNAYF